MQRRRARARRQHAHPARRGDALSGALSLGIRVGLVLVLWMPLIVAPDVYRPTVVGKALYARGLMEIITGLWLVLLVWNPSYRPRRSWVVLALGAYVLVSLLSTVFAVSPTHSLWSDYRRMMGVVDLIHWFLFVLVAASVLRTRREWASLLNWNLGVALALCILAVAQGYGVALLPYIEVPAGRLYATLGNPLYLAAVLIVAIIIAVGFLTRSFIPGDGQDVPDRRALGDYLSWPPSLVWRRGFWAVTAALGLWVLFQTGGRGALVGLTAGTVAMPIALAAWGNRGVLRPVLLASIGILLAMGLLFLLDATGSFPAPSRVQGAVASSRLAETTLQDRSLSSRLDVSRLALGAFARRPLLGWGPDNFEYAFDRLADPSFYRYGRRGFDQVHNRVMEELATRGVLGIIAFAALWVSLVWAVVRRGRGRREEILAYAVLGGLVAYFVQNLFLFDSPAMLLQWAVLAAWVAGQEHPSEAADAPASSGRRPHRPIAAPPLARGLATVLVVAMVGASLVFLTYRPYVAARQFEQALAGPGTVAERLALAQRSFDTFPPLATVPRADIFAQLASRWNEMNLNQRRAVAEFVIEETERGTEAAPENARLLVGSLPILQAVAGSPEALERLDPLVERLRELAPGRAYTYERMAEQELRKGNYQAALEIIDGFLAEAPPGMEGFEELQEAALEGKEQ